MLFVRDRIFAVDIIDMFIGDNESVWVKLSCNKNLEVCVGVCYRSPNINDEENRCLMNAIKFFSKDLVVIMGDFNQKDINWNLLQSDSRKGKDFLEVMNELFLTQHVHQGTRGENLLDLVFSSQPELVENLEVCSSVSNSDHNSLVFKICVETRIENDMRTIFNYHQADFEKINSVLGEINWEEKFIDNNVESNWVNLVDELVECRSKYVPTKTINKGNYPKWMKKHIKTKN